MEYPKQVQEIYEVFKDYYTEELVDLQEATNYDNTHYTHTQNDSLVYKILIHWPEVEITNEYNNSITIWGLWCAIFLTEGGKLLQNPHFVRSEYDEFQWNNGYIHSHIQSLEYSKFQKFKTSCLGQGPLSRHCTDLRTDESKYKDLDIWNLFVWELDKYVHVESLAGVPYRRLTEIAAFHNNTNTKCTISLYPNGLSNILEEYRPLLCKFIEYIINNQMLKFSYSNGTYLLGNSNEEVIILLSNAFIKMYNEDSSIQSNYIASKVVSNFLIKAFHSNGELYTNINPDIITDISSVEGTELFTFKGNPVTLVCRDGTRNIDNNSIYILKPHIIGYILYKILRFLDFYYGNEEIKTNKVYRVI